MPPSIGLTMDSQARRNKVTIHLSDVDRSEEIPDRIITLEYPDWVTEIGRGSSTDDVILPQQSNLWYTSKVMSRHHAELSANPVTKSIFIKDKSSMHGTYLNGEAVTRSPSQVIKDDILTFGTRVIRGTDAFEPLKTVVSFEWAEDTKDMSATSGNTFTADYGDIDAYSDLDDEVELIHTSVRQPSVEILETEPVLRRAAAPSSANTSPRTNQSAILSISSQSTPSVHSPVVDKNNSERTNKVEVLLNEGASIDDEEDYNYDYDFDSEAESPFDPDLPSVDDFLDTDQEEEEDEEEEDRDVEEVEEPTDQRIAEADSTVPKLMVGTTPLASSLTSSPELTRSSVAMREPSPSDAAMPRSNYQYPARFESIHNDFRAPSRHTADMFLSPFSSDNFSLQSPPPPQLPPRPAGCNDDCSISTWSPAVPHLSSMPFNFAQGRSYLQPSAPASQFMTAPGSLHPDHKRQEPPSATAGPFTTLKVAADYVPDVYGEYHRSNLKRKAAIMAGFDSGVRGRADSPEYVPSSPDMDEASSSSDEVAEVIIEEDPVVEGAVGQAPMHVLVEATASEKIVDWNDEPAKPLSGLRLEPDTSEPPHKKMKVSTLSNDRATPKASFAKSIAKGAAIAMAGAAAGAVGTIFTLANLPTDYFV